MRIYDRIVYYIFGKHIEKLAKERLKDLAFDKYINENLDISNVGKGEIRFLGHKFIKLLAWSFNDILEDAENYVSIDVTSEGKVVNIIIQKPGKMTPHQKADMYKKKYDDLINDNK